MFKRRLGPWRFIVAGVMGVSAQIIAMIFAAVEKGGWPAGFGVMATIASSLWLDDAEGDRSTRKQNKVYIISIMTSVFLTCAFVSVQSVSLALMIQLMLEFAFMVAMITETKFMP